MRNKCVQLLIVLLALSLTALSAFADDLADVKAKGKLVFGTATESIPFVFYDETGYLTGLDVELVREIGRRMGVGIEPVDMAFEGLFDALTIGQVDIVGGTVSKTADRAEMLDLSRAYYSGTAHLLSLAGKAPAGAITTEIFRGKKLGVERGTSFAQWAYQNLVSAGILEKKDIFLYANGQDTMKALDAGVVDYAFLDQDVYEKGYEKSGRYQVVTDQFSKEFYVFAMRKNSTLTAEVNRILGEMLKDGTAQTIADQFFAMDFTESRSISRNHQATPTPTAVVTAAVKSGTCTNAMQFIQDMSISDGQTFNPGASFTKTWRVRNIGTCAWYEGYYIDFSSGDRMEGNAVRINRIVYPGEYLDISVGMKSPANAGTYRGYWQLKSASGVAFGNTMWCSIRVQGSARTTATASPSYVDKAPITITSFKPSAYSGIVGSTVYITWSAKAAMGADLYINGKLAAYGNGSSGSFTYTFNQSGTYSVSLNAWNNVDEKWESFSYSVYDQSAYSQPSATPAELGDLIPEEYSYYFTPSATPAERGDLIPEEYSYYFTPTQEPVYEWPTATSEPVYEWPTATQEPVYEWPTATPEPVYEWPTATPEPVYEWPTAEPVYEWPTATPEPVYEWPTATPTQEAVQNWEEQLPEWLEGFDTWGGEESSNESYSQEQNWSDGGEDWSEDYEEWSDEEWSEFFDEWDGEEW